jgi:hypothetical protein
MSTQSVLDQMTAAIMSSKEQKAATLTPVGMETPAIARVKGDVFPFDSGAVEQVVHSARVIREELASIEAALRSIERAVGTPEGGPPPVVVVSPKEQAAIAQREVEQKADATFKAHYDEQSREAQAQVFTAQDSTQDEGWVCPAHGDTAVQTRTSRKGREFQACGLCQEFERRA